MRPMVAAGDPAFLTNSLRMRPVRIGRVRCEATERPVLLFQTRVRVLAVGGNGRVQTASDTWLFLASGATRSESGGLVFCPVKGKRLV